MVVSELALFVDVTILTLRWWWGHHPFRMRSADARARSATRLKSPTMGDARSPARFVWSERGRRVVDHHLDDAATDSTSVDDTRREGPR